MRNSLHREIMREAAACGRMKPRPTDTAGSMVDHDALRAAFHAHKEGSTKFTRRMAINIGDLFGLTPWQVIRHYEGAGLLKRGTADWFRHNGGFSKENFAEARADRTASPEN